MLKQRFMNRVNSDRGDSLSVSQIVWIAITVTLVIGIGGIIGAALKNKADDTANKISGANGDESSLLSK